MKKLSREKRAQVGLEYLIVVGFVTFAAIFLLATSNYYQRKTEDQVVSSQVYSIARNLVDAAENVYYHGYPARTQIEAYMPDRVEEILINNTEINFKVRLKSGITDITSYSDVNLTGTITTTPGLKKIIIESKGDYINVSSI